MGRPVGTLDADGIMIRAASVLGKYHAELGLKPHLKWNTEARTSAYLNAYYAEKDRR